MLRGDCGWAAARGVKQERAVEQSVRLAGLSAWDWAEATSWATGALSEAGPRGEGSLLGCRCENGPRGKVWAELFGLDRPGWFLGFGVWAFSFFYFYF